MPENKSTYQLYITQQATHDLIAIQRYTAQQYGASQARRYAVQIKEKLDLLCETPNLGHNRSDIPAHYKALTVGQHVVLYDPDHDKKTIYIVMILHGHMHFPDHISP